MKRIRLAGTVLAIGLTAAACSGDSTALPECPPGETLGFDSDVCIPIDTSPPNIVSSSTTSTTSTTTTTVPDTTTTTTVVESAVEQLDTSPVITDGQIPDELTWAEEGTPEADIERAFWIANAASRAIFTEDILDPNYPPFIETHTGQILERITTSVAELPAGEFYRYPEPSDIRIEFISLVTATEALMQVCELERSEYYTDGELNDDRDFDSQFQARFVLNDDGQWLREETIKLKFEPLEGDQPTCMADLNT